MIKKIYTSILLACCLITSTVRADNITSKVSIVVDEKIELTSIAYFIAGLGFGKNFHSYTWDCYNYFEKYKSHKAIQKLKSFINKKNNDSAFVALAAFVDSNFVFHPEQMVRDDYEDYDSWYGIENIRAFFLLLKDFKEVSNFDAFFKAHQSQYKEWVKNYRQAMDKKDIVKKFNEYFKHEYTWKVYISPLYGGSHAILRDNEYNKTHITFLQGITSLRKRSKKESPEIGAYPKFIWHEGTHCVMSGYTYQAYKKDIEKLSYLFDHIKTRAFKNYHFDRWTYAFDEMLVQSVVCSIFIGGKAKEPISPYNGNNLLLNEMAKGLVYEYFMLDEIRKYYNSHNSLNYTVIENIIERLKSVSVSELENDKKFNHTNLMRALRATWKR